MVWDEVAILNRIEGRRMKTLGMVIQGATMTTGFTASPEAVKHFSEMLTILDGE